MVLGHGVHDYSSLAGSWDRFEEPRFREHKRSAYPSDSINHDPKKIIPEARGGFTKLDWASFEGRYGLGPNSPSGKYTESGMGRGVIYATVGSRKEVKASEGQLEEIAAMHKPNLANAYFARQIGDWYLIQYVRIK